MLRRLNVPNFPAVPKLDEPLAKWAEELTNELNQWFRRAIPILVDDVPLFSMVKQSVVAGFTILPVAFYIQVYHTGDVTSSLTTAIKNGDAGQLIVIENMGTGLLTIANGANTSLSAGVNETLGLDRCMMLRWDGTVWAEIGGQVLIIP